MEETPRDLLVRELATPELFSVRCETVMLGPNCPDQPALTRFSDALPGDKVVNLNAMIQALREECYGYK